MLIPRDELRYDFQGACFDLGPGARGDADRRFLGWVFNQFLYGEVTGIQCGHWLYRAPHLNAAAFLAKQAGEELSHVRKILRILTLLGQRPGPAHPAVRFLATGMMGGSWGEHVALEMALGEGLVLTAFYALAETIEEPEIRRILESAVSEEERHVEFGERETRAWLERRPRDRKLLLALALFQSVALRRLKRFVLRKVPDDHPVLRQFDAFYDHVLRGFDARIERLGLSPRPLSRMGAAEKLWLTASFPWLKLRAWLLAPKQKPLTSTYLDDPVLIAENVRRS